jgi:hypothetical protein
MQKSCASDRTTFTEIAPSQALSRRTNGTFAPGISGNPHGRPKAWDEMTALCREHTPLAIATLAEIAGDKKQPAASRVTAAVALLDRGYGRPAQSLDIRAQAGNPFDGISDEGLRDMLETIGKLRERPDLLNVLVVGETAKQ